jgi:hypothetical protein
MSEAEKIDKLVAACRAYHEALDIAFAMLIITTGDHPERMSQFFPSKKVVDEITAEQRQNRPSESPPETSESPHDESI